MFQIIRSNLKKWLTTLYMILILCKYIQPNYNGFALACYPGWHQLYPYIIEVICRYRIRLKSCRFDSFRINFLLLTWITLHAQIWNSINIIKSYLGKWNYARSQWMTNMFFNLILWNEPKTEKENPDFENIRSTWS